MKRISRILIVLLAFITANATESIGEKHNQATLQISQYHMVSEQLASAATPELHHYQQLKDAGFKHIIVLSTGLHLVEKTHAEALGLTFEQVSVSLTEPTEYVFTEFSALLDTYGDEPVLVYSEQNWRAATFVYRYQGLKSVRLVAVK